MQKQQGRWERQIRWIKEGAKNFRLSLSLRVSLNYLRIFLINGIIFFFILGFLYVREEMKPSMEVVEQMVVLLEMDEEKFVEYAVREQPQNLAVFWTDNEKTTMLYENGDENWQEYRYLFGFCHLERKNGEWKLLIKDKQEIFRKGQKYEITFYYDATEGVEKSSSFLRSATILYLVLTLFIIWESRRDNKRIFAPIKNLTETARNLTVTNLHSERLPVRGTEKELRELTQVFNDMLDRLELSYESQKQFVSNASHELRTPIAVIQGYSRMLSRWGSSDPEILNEAVEAIGDESKAMQELVEKLLFLSRHDRKTLKVQKGWFSMGEVVEDMVKETRMVTENREIKARLIQNVSVYGDDQLLKQAIRVLIDNAIKYSDEGDTITIGCENRNGNCVLTVEDTGRGMKKEDVDHMFERFYRSDDIRGKIDGHGLGLSIARLIILAHAGTIKVRTQYTVGTSFTITLPRQRMAPRHREEQR
ncbi:MAG: HAMP domain-containing histidine kinase [Lachnospiraceae bacterium]|nr:HAMP domain-containing histidine kinase [Lachnospiraceae bacterium]